MAVPVQFAYRVATARRRLGSGVEVGQHDFRQVGLEPCEAAYRIVRAGRPWGGFGGTIPVV